jgi:hypothetical protein
MDQVLQKCQDCQNGSSCVLMVAMLESLCPDGKVVDMGCSDYIRESGGMVIDKRKG